MAHSCPECYETCYCNGDIDDCLFDFDEDVEACNHYLQCSTDLDDLNDFDDYEEQFA